MIERHRAGISSWWEYPWIDALLWWKTPEWNRNFNCMITWQNQGLGVCSQRLRNKMPIRMSPASDHLWYRPARVKLWSDQLANNPQICVTLCSHEWNDVGASRLDFGSLSTLNLMMVIWDAFQSSFSAEKKTGSLDVKSSMDTNFFFCWWDRFRQLT